MSVAVFRRPDETLLARVREERQRRGMQIVFAEHPFGRFGWFRKPEETARVRVAGMQ